MADSYCPCWSGVHVYDYTLRMRFDQCPECGAKWKCGSICTVGRLPDHEPAKS